jgi:hypothetical protein
MANNCSNYILITGSSENVAKAVAFWVKELKDEYDKINYLTDLSIFTPEEKEKKDVYESCGTKWIDTGWIDEDITESTSITCDTAWSPCNPLLKRIAETFDVKCENEYNEPGCDFGGKYECTKDSESDDCMSYLKYVGKYEGDRLGFELDYFVEDDNLTKDILDEVKEFLTDDEYNEYLTKIKEETTNEQTKTI